MAVTHSTAARNAATDAVTALIGANGRLAFRLSGTVGSPGTVYAYADGVLIDSTTGMSTATTSANTSMFAAVEINSAGGTSTANAIGYISNLRTFVAHG